MGLYKGTYRSRYRTSVVAIIGEAKRKHGCAETLYQEQAVSDAFASCFRHRAQQICFESIGADCQRDIQQPTSGTCRSEVILSKKDFSAFFEGT